MSEGQHYLDQLETIDCPLCGSPLPESPKKGDGALSVSGVYVAYTQEAAKIRSHVGDLEGTVTVLQKEQTEVTIRMKALRNRVAEIDQYLAATLAPQMAVANKQVRELIHQRSQLLYAESLEARLTAIREIRAGLANPVEESEAEPTEGRVQIDEQSVTDFCEMMRDLLERWHFLSPKAQVSFDTAKFDFVIDGQARRNNGKGVRAIIHAAFNIALMRYCLAKNLPHARFAILDSPLTTFKERGQATRLEDLDEVPGEVQTAFFEDLAKVQANEQIIVIENKQPPPSIKERLTYVQFVGYDVPGRAGFFPIAKA